MQFWVHIICKDYLSLTYSTRHKDNVLVPWPDMTVQSLFTSSPSLRQSLDSVINQRKNQSKKGQDTVIQNARSRSQFVYDIWMLKTGQLCLIFINKGQFLLKKIIQGHKGQKGQWRPTKASIAQNFKFLCYYHYSM